LFVKAVQSGRAADQPLDAVRFRGSTAFKEQIHQQLHDVPELPEGGVHVQIGYLVGPRRYWPNL
jgi:hypothetical protein